MEIYISKDSQILGPYREGEIRTRLEDGSFDCSEMACRKGMDSWVNVKELLEGADIASQLFELRDSVVGEYEHKYKDGDTYKQVYLDSGIRELYKNGKKQTRERNEWTILDEEIHVSFGGGRFKEILKVNADKSITWIADISDGEREDFPKEDQSTFKKIN